ncbi:Uncharacterized protein PECH_002081 [Penicillium ucsense]|uniref:DUF726 domain protein n=1 Tax=Penicillium ucsense TaxID=2839758 RepID=A0A8J8W4Z8_9EURO|nr:Uncharacterized protein PECM_002644 [Penicillium ucsense]KAF7738043.1 Uncharacterized protein PECH_002081 [Penicillium ucsense]
MFKNLKDKTSFFETKSADKSQSADQKEDAQDLTSILTRSQRGDLTVLVAEIAESMRVSILEVFEPQESNTSTGSSPSQTPVSENGEQEAQSPGYEHPPARPPRQNSGQRLNATAAAAKTRAKKRTLDHLEKWRVSVLQRIGEVVNQENESGKMAGPDSAAKKDDLPLEEDEERKNVLRQVFHPIETPLRQLPKATRLLILHSLLLLLLSLKHYNAYSRVLLLHVAASLDIDISVLNDDEKKVARGLLDAVLAQSQEAGKQPEPTKNDSSRKWKVGLASVAGAALIGITGGLAAPLVAAGIGGVMGGLGLGATAAAGYLGTLAGSSVLVGGLFGAYGGRMTGRTMEKYAREVEDFAFIPIRGQQKSQVEDESDEAKEDHRLRVTIGVTGWVKDVSDFWVPWRVLGDDSEVFALQWETEAMMNLGTSLTDLVTSAVWSVASQKIISHTVFATLASAVFLPMGLIKIARLVDNPFSLAKARADKAGEALADALINKAQGERAVTLIGYSLGSRVIYSCMQTLCRKSAYGLVESVVLMGSATPADVEAWRRIRSVVSGRVVNVYSQHDSLLAFLYRTSSLQAGVAGLQPIEGVSGVENVDATEKIKGHLNYQFYLGQILDSIGLQDLDLDEVKREEAAGAEENKKQEEERARKESNAQPEDRGVFDATDDDNDPQRNAQEAPSSQSQANTHSEGHSKDHSDDNSDNEGTHHRIQMLDLDD